MSSQLEAAQSGQPSAEVIAQQQLFHSILMRSATDREFRQLLLADPHAAFASAGVELPATTRLRFVENEHDVTLVLPDAVGEVVELEESELAGVNGQGILSAIGEFLSLVEPPTVVFGTGSFGGGGASGSW
jgi:uncharacterized membrane protein YgcG